METWLAEKSGNRDYYEELKRVWQFAEHSSVDENKAWERFRKRIEPEVSGSKKVKKQDGFPWLKIAASILVVAGLAWYGLWVYRHPHQPPLQVAQTMGEVLTDTLPDGSVVTLNKESSITYPSRFQGEKRSVALKGEAFFHVTPDTSRPFVIDVNDVQVTVVGTSFNIRSQDGRTVVIVETGVVRVSHNGEVVELHANERLSVDASENMHKENVKDKLYNYYRSKEFVCDDTPLWKLVEVLNEAYDAHIIIGRQELKDQRINITLNNESLERVLDLISLTFNIKVRKTNEGVILE